MVSGRWHTFPVAAAAPEIVKRRGNIVVWGFTLENALFEAQILLPDEFSACWTPSVLTDGHLTSLDPEVHPGQFSVWCLTTMTANK